MSHPLKVNHSPQPTVLFVPCPENYVRTIKVDGVRLAGRWFDIALLIAILANAMIVSLETIRQFSTSRNPVLPSQNKFFKNPQ